MEDREENSHRNCRVIVGVTGGIAAYKSAELVRCLIRRGCQVRVVMTHAACSFITPLTLQAVSGHPVHQHLLDADVESGMGHIELARWADRVVIAPATADFMAKMAHGYADDLLSTLVLATSAQVVLAPAMNQQMWQHCATQSNLSILRSRNIRIIGPDSGGQACGEIGVGRMAEPEDIVSRLLGPAEEMMLAGRQVLLTAGPTWEAMDPIRGITNHSSGKMGFALAAAAADQGAEVILVSGPVHLPTPARVCRVDIQSAEEMLQAVQSRMMGIDLFIAVAAVADFRPKHAEEDKIKKTDGMDSMTLTLVRNRDILATVAAMDTPPFTVGFAAETQDVLANARAKRKSKAVDMIVANHIGEDDKVFGSDRNTVTLVHSEGEISLPSGTKYSVAVEILREVSRRMNAA